jgi:integration host factor subunit alpha
MTKNDLIEAVCHKLDQHSKKDAQDVVETVINLIKDRLEQGESIKLPGFGNFSVREKRSRVGRNPKTGEGVEIAARKVISFKPSAILRSRVNGGTGRVIADITSQHIAITGTLDMMSRDEAIKHIRKAGGKFTQSITQQTTVLVVGIDPGLNKLGKAKQYKVQHINEEEFFRLVGASHTRRLPGL